MNKKNYDMMNWEEIEAVVYGDCKDPYEILGVKKKGKNKLLQCFYPGAESITAEFNVDGKNKKLKLEKVDDEGFFAEFFDFEYSSYILEIKYDDKTVKCHDPYEYEVKTDLNFEKNILKGESKNAYEYLGSHKKTYDGVSGYEFIVYAPNALSVSVIGDFNNWNENANLMKMDKLGFYSIFIPDLADNSQYKYVIKGKGFKGYKNDPFAKGIFDKNSVCKDVKISKKKKTLSLKDDDLQILEVSLSDLLNKYEDKKKVLDFILDSVKKNKYDTVSLLPVLKSSNDDIYQIMNGFSFDDENGLDFETFSYICENLSKEKIKVLVELPLAYVSDNESGLAFFDGSHLFENDDFRLNSHKKYNAMLFDYNKEFTKSYLYSSVDYFFKNFDIDGITVPNAGLMLYHDYNKNPGEYITEEWGNTINSSSVAFLKDINKYIHTTYKNAISVASIYAYFNNVTGKDKNSLGFDYCINSGATEELIEFLSLAPSYRRDHLDSFLVFTHFVNDQEKYIYPFSRKENTKYDASLLQRMPGDDVQKLANMKIAVIFKHLLKGSQLINSEVDTYNGTDDKNAKAFEDFYEDFRKIYLNAKELVKSTDGEPFKYKCIENQIITREYFDGSKHYVLVFNFSNDSYEEYKIPVSREGVYKEVFNSDEKKYGGSNLLNKKALSTEEDIENGIYTLDIKVPNLSIVAFSYREYTDVELEEIYQKKKKKAFDYVNGETKKIKEKLDEDIKELKNQAQIKIKELELLLKPYDH